MKFLDTVNKKLQLLSEQEGFETPQAPGMADPADATAPANVQAAADDMPSPEDVDESGKEEEGSREAEKELCVQIVLNLVSKIVEKIRSSDEDGRRQAVILDKIIELLKNRSGELKEILLNVNSETQEL